MRIMISYRLAEDSEAHLLSDNIVYRPDLDKREPWAVGKALREWRPDVLIARRQLTEEVIAAWLEARAGRAVLTVYVTQDQRGVSENASSPRGVSAQVVYGPTQKEADCRALVCAERYYNRNVTCRENDDILARRQNALGPSQTVALVGAGIVNAMTAYYLQRAGYRVTVFEDSPDPRTPAPWTRFGCTNGGDDARMFTLSEADDYHDKGDAVFRSLTSEMNTLFRRDVRDLGWLICDPARLGERERSWIADFECVPPWLAELFNKDIFLFNRESMPLWKALRDDAPELFRDVEYRPGILRLYPDREHFQRQVLRQNRLDATRAVLEPQEIKAKYSALSDAVDRGEIAGGIEVVGFTVNIHKFMARLIGYLERGGATFHWNTRVNEIQRNDRGGVTGLRLERESVRADHYVVSSGVYGNELLLGLRSENRIHGVLGLWIRLPNLEPKLCHSLKIARRGHMAEDSNVTVAKDHEGREILILGSGYGYTGSLPDNIRPDLIDELFVAVEDTAKRFFPRSYKKAVDQGMLAESRRYCVRPWTPSCLGVFEIAEAERNGVLIITGGHNTGGFTQSPSVAQAVLAALRGVAHPMHDYYHPDRLRRFTAASEGVLALVEH